MKIWDAIKKKKYIIQNIFFVYINTQIKLIRKFMNIAIAIDKFYWNCAYLDRIIFKYKSDSVEEYHNWNI